MKCPYCDNEILLIEDKLDDNAEVDCYGKDHIFFQNCRSWFICHTTTNLFIDSNVLCDNLDPNIVYAQFKHLSPSEAAKVLKRMAKLKAFL